MLYENNYILAISIQKTWKVKEEKEKKEIKVEVEVEVKEEENEIREDEEPPRK